VYRGQPPVRETPAGFGTAAVLNPLDIVGRLGSALSSKVIGAVGSVGSKIKGMGEAAAAGGGVTGALGGKLAGTIGAIQNVGSSILRAFGGPQLAMLEVGFRSAAAALQKLTETLNDINDIDERLAIINEDLATTLEGNTNALMENTQGFGLALKALTELKVAGFDQTNKNLIGLTTRVKLSGQDTGAVIQLATNLLGTGGMQEESIDRLAGVIVENSKVYGTTIDSMVKAVDALNANIQSLTLMGGAEAATSTAAQLTAILGQENAQVVGRLVKELTSTQTDFNIQAVLGVESLGDSIAMNLTDLNKVVQGLIDGSIRAKNLVGASADVSRRVLGATYGGTSQLTLDLITVGDKLIDAQKQGMAGTDELMKTLTAFKQIILDPFKDVVSSMLPAFKLFVGGISYLISSLLNLVTRVFGPSIKLVIGAVGAIAGVIGMVVDAVASFVEFVYDIISNIPIFGKLFEDTSGNTNATLKNIESVLGIVTNNDTKITNVVAQTSTRLEGDRFRTDATSILVRDSIIDMSRDLTQALLENRDVTQVLVDKQQSEEQAKTRERLEKLQPLERNPDVLVGAALDYLDERARVVQGINSSEIADAISSQLGTDIKNQITLLSQLIEVTRDNKPKEQLPSSF
jgi:hypothetical protein